VNECPVDIEHIDHINGMRRHQVLVESAFPTEATTMLNNLERRGNPWGMAEGKRGDWISELDFEVPVLDGVIPDDTEYLFWVGCAGALDERAKATTKAVAELLHNAGVSFAVLGPAETCTGDPARRLGNEFVYSMLAQQNIETLNYAGVARGSGKKVIASCAHCFNTIGREYPQLGGNYDVLHHTEVLAQLITDKKITPVTETGQKVTYHDPCFLGRHNKVFTPPRELIDAVPGAEAQEMERSGERSFCCGAGGARMWLEENTGTRINDTRATEALDTGADVIATACPYCNVMLGDAINAKKANGQARDNVEVIDVAQLLVRTTRLREQAGGEGG
jgi:Fe-S oxidoreductase